MPTYEYGCAECGSEWEEVQRITAPPIEICPKCGKASAHRLISAGGGFILKGGGWYSDLYSSAKPASNKADSNGTTSADTGSKTEGNAEKSSGGEAKTTETKASPSATPAAPTSPSTPASSSSS
ncbi:MAG TPA: FmdB family zinc ribbon protein [Polyangiaceae bacterium]|jgi:putative FmdB family regulatory protein